MMKEATRTEYTWTLEEHETFEWVKSTGAHEGHAFTVTKVQLEHRDSSTSTVYLHGPWLHGFQPDDVVREDGSVRKNNGGWEFLYPDHVTGAEAIRQLPLEVRESLAVAGLRIPLEVDGHGF